MRAQLLADLFFSLALVVPVINIFKRAGLNQWLSLVLFIPFFGFVACGVVLANSQWKISGGRSSS